MADIPIWPLIDALRTALASGTGKLVEVGHAPDTPDVDVRSGLLVSPYAIVYAPIASTNNGGLASGDEMTDVLVQITSVGRDERQCLMMGDLVRSAFRAATVAPTGLRVISRTIEEATLPTQEGQVVSMAQRFTVAVEAA